MSNFLADVFRRCFKFSSFLSCPSCSKHAHIMTLPPPYFKKGTRLLGLGQNANPVSWSSAPERPVSLVRRRRTTERRRPNEERKEKEVKLSPEGFDVTSSDGGGQPATSAGTRLDSDGRRVQKTKFGSLSAVSAAAAEGNKPSAGIHPARRAITSARGFN